ncbi:MAG TPA: M15 family metallopeptidase [Candidatus Enterococcus avicola]|uniref:M15 family metallopeptidase n=1 Tax=Candidatus Enterococcus avicola TaxID=2838561 RepID=A0A9D2JIT6_9ENTE|nr:M15 family metallopeptidase [Candidatus Enterococcus avicola]
MKKIIATITMSVLGVILIYGINRFVTREYVPKGTKEAITSKINTLNEQEQINEKKVSEPLPEGELTDWNLVLVGPSHKLKEEATETLTTLDNGMMLDHRIVDPYSQMLIAAQEDGIDLMLVSGYRSISYQEQIFNENVNALIYQGESEVSAKKIVKQTSTEPGYSEHHTGLTFDIVDQDWSNNFTDNLLSEAYAETRGGIWLATHAREYGFILRYPKGKEEITEISFEPWHYRYVGIEHAKYIEAHQLTLEEYLDLLKET